MHRYVRLTFQGSIAAVTVVATAAFFASPAAAMSSAQRSALAAVYDKRADLQTAFDPVSWLPVDQERTVGIADLETWARQYGYKEMPELAVFAPGASGDMVPVEGISATSYIVMDEHAGETILEYAADAGFAPGSAAKLMTALVLMDRGVLMDGQVTMGDSDRIGGLALAAPTGATTTIGDLMYAMLVGSANDAAMALVRASGMSSASFTDAMNAKAKALGMDATRFTGPSGIEDDATTTARDLARLVAAASDDATIKRMTTTSARDVRAGGRTYRVASANELLTDPDNGLYVLGGKNGYVPGAEWGVAVRMMDAKREPVVVVTAGSPASASSFADARAVAERAWYGETAAVGAASGVADGLRAILADVYADRADLRMLFNPSTWQAVPSPRTEGLTTLEDWARQYGYKEMPELVAFAPVAARQEERYELPRALVVNETARLPVRDGDAADLSPKLVTASSVLVVDAESRKVLLEMNARAPHPMASISKLMTAMVVRERGVSMSQAVMLTSEDKKAGECAAAGACLRVDEGVTLTVGDLMYAMLVGSANDTAHALSRSAGASYEDFVAEMNTKARALGLSRTVFEDPSGLDVDNVSTAEEIAALAFETFDDRQIRAIASTAKKEIWTTNGTHQLTNTNALLTDPDNGLIVLGGKTGYLIESKWNLVVEMMDARRKPVMVVVLGSGSQTDSFRDARTAAEWAWGAYDWP